MRSIGDESIRSKDFCAKDKGWRVGEGSAGSLDISLDIIRDHLISLSSIVSIAVFKVLLLPKLVELSAVRTFGSSSQHPTSS